MIPATTHGVRRWAWTRYVNWRVQKAFRGIWLRGPLPPPQVPLLFYANHSAWWDGFAFHQLCRVLKRTAYCFMDEKNLKQYKFLRHLGAFSISLNDPLSARQSFHYAASLLAHAGNAVVIFPEGELRPQAEAPLQMKSGVSLLARMANCQCVPVGLRYPFFEDPRPDLLIELGERHGPAPMAHFVNTLNQCVTSLQSANSLAPFSRIDFRHRRPERTTADARREQPTHG